MTYETIDWDAEAKRISRAFGLEGEYAFIDSGQGYKFFQLKGTFPIFANQPVNSTTGQLFIDYGKKSRYFMLTSEDLYCELEISWDGRPDSPFTDSNNPLSFPLARALFFLNLLTPEVEAAIKVSITAHQKMEWQLEYQARTGTTQ